MFHLARVPGQLRLLLLGTGLDVFPRRPMLCGIPLAKSHSRPHVKGVDPVAGEKQIIVIIARRRGDAGVGRQSVAPATSVTHSEWQ